MVCDSLLKKYPPLSDGAGPVDLWRRRERSRAPQEKSELFAASDSVAAAAAATVNDLFVTVFDTGVEVLLGGNAKFTSLERLPTLTLDDAATKSEFTTPTRSGHKEL